MTETKSHPDIRAYMIRAIRDWSIDCGYTPHLEIDYIEGEVIAPKSYIVDGKMVFNISAKATVDFKVDNEGVSFKARFGGIIRDVYVPLSAVFHVYARENNIGAYFADKPMPEEGLPLTSAPIPPKGKPHLKLVKNDEEQKPPKS